jgi:hypothetical protein
MKASKAAALLQHDIEHFTLFLKSGKQSVELKRDRVAQAAALVAHPKFAKAPLETRVGFLRWQGLTREEIEEAFEGGDAADYAEVLELDSIDAAPRPRGGSTSSTAHAAADHAPADPNAPGTVVHLADGYWRVGATVFAYKGDLSYYPVPLLGFDLARVEDVIAVSHQLPSGEYGPRQYLPPGFKGVIPDEYPMHAATRVGMTIIVRDPDSHGRERYREAVVLRMVDPNADGDFTVDIEWTHTSTEQAGVDYRDFRLIYHPKVLLQRLAEQEEAARLAQGANERIDSAGAFLCIGELSRAEQLRIARQKSKDSPTPEAIDPTRITTHVKGFMHFPHLDIFEQPRDVRTGASYVSHYGDAALDGAPRTAPLYPPSQEGQTGVGFRFSLVGLEHHERSKHHLKYNPIALIAEQCIKVGSMFVDPDFPPSEYSLHGPDALSGGLPRGHVVWRRLSEVYYRPRLQALGSKAVNCKPGRYAPPWLTEMLGAFQMTTEAEDITSPGDDGWLFGAYALRLFVEGRWAFVVVDDFVPCDPETGNPVCCDAGSSSDIQWTLIEKALAKLQGSYRALQVPNPAFTLPRVWEDLTSNPTDMVEHEHLSFKSHVCSNLCDIVLEEQNSCCVLARVTAGTRFIGLGAEEGALWHVDSVAEYVPPGRETESTFSFHVVRRAYSNLAVKRIDQAREQLLEEIGRAATLQLPEVPQAEVSYWMSSAEYFAVFDRTYCLRLMNNFQKLSVAGTFRARRNPGGKADGDVALLRNPQYLLSFMQPSECILELQLTDRRLGTNKSIDASTLQLHLIKGHAAERPWTLEDDGAPIYIASTPQIDLREDVEWRNQPTVNVRLSLQGGNYILLPTVGSESTEAFTIKVFSVSAFYVKLLN